jgi:two-component sensor histidine kinase
MATIGSSSTMRMVAMVIALRGTTIYHGAMRGKKTGNGYLQGSDGDFTFPFDSFAFKLQGILFVRYRLASLAVAVIAYAATILLFGDSLAVSSNYFVLVPVIAAALGFGAWAGLAAGAVALPANLLLFYALGHPEFSPASKLIAEISGIGVGFTFGCLADYFSKVESEIKRRIYTEDALRDALAEKGLLLRELNHRVKNNLNVIKSLVQLQRNRSKDPVFLEASDELIGRIFAISLVHDQLNKDQALSMVNPSEYLRALVGNVESGLGLGDSSIGLELDTGERSLQMEAATSLGLIVNEVLTNSIKYAAPCRDGKPSIRLSFRADESSYRLVIVDDGPGPDSETRDGGLGLKLVRALARNLGGAASLEAVQGECGPTGARFELTFPTALMEYH